MAYHSDREITRDVPAYRRMLAHVTPSRAQASVTFTQTLDLSRTLPWLEAESARQGRRVSLLNLYLLAAGRVFHRHPHLNRYATGARFFQRDGVTLSVSTKKALVHGAKVVLLKLPVQDDDTLDSLGARLDGMLREGRAEGDLPQERENAMLLWLGPLLPLVVRFAFWLDRRHWLPPFLCDPDPLFTSMVVANLGSVGLEACHHHLYEWGNCPFFAVLGKVGHRVQVDGDTTSLRPSVEVAYTFDERVEDGLACALALEDLKRWMEDPASMASAG